MQDVIILTQLNPLASSLYSLVAMDHLGERVSFFADETQRVNVLALEYQSLPCVVLVDSVRTVSAGREVDADVMLSILPMSTKDIDAVLTAGAADKLMRFARGEE